MIGLLGCLAFHTLPFAAAHPAALPAMPRLRLAHAAKPGDLRPQELRCEYLTNPLAVEATPGRALYWTSWTTQRGEMQSAYQIVAASHLSDLKAGRADLWDSGKVASDQSIACCVWGQTAWVGGARLVEGARVGQSREMSPPTVRPRRGRWACCLPPTGKRNGSECPTKTEVVAADAMEGCVRWIWYPEGDPLRSAPAADRWFSRRAGRFPISQVLFAGRNLSASPTTPLLL